MRKANPPPLKGPVRKPKLFVLMPFGDGKDSSFNCNFDQWYAKIIQPAGEAAGMEVERGDNDLLSLPIMQQVWRYIRVADIVLAFLTSRNPNVFYELGFTHAIGRPVLLVADDREKLPFDIAHLRHYLYNDNNVDKVGVFVPAITQRLQAILANPNRAVLEGVRRKRPPLVAAP